MPEPIDVAYVRIRPDFSGFQAEAGQKIRGSLAGVARETDRVGVGARGATRDVERFNRGIIAANASALGFGRALTFASTAFLGGAGLGALIRAGVNEFSSMTTEAAKTNALLKATGGVANITASGIDRLANRLLNLTGVDDELIKASESILLTFRNIRNEVGPGNQIFTRATEDALDLSKVLGGDLTGSALQLGKALEDPVRGVTALRRSGVSFSADQQKLIKSLVETGQILSAQKLILGEVERQVGGTARAIGETLPVRLSILRERATNALGDYVRRLSESREAAELAADGARGLGQAFNVVQGTVRTIGPPLVATARAATALSEAVGGVGPIIAAVAAYKAVGIAVGIAGTAQAAYTRATVIARGATIAETEALVAQAAAARAAGTSTVFQSLTGGAARATVAVRGLRVASAALGGPIGIAAIGAAGLTLGVLALRRQAQNAAGTLNALRRSLQGLSQAVNEARRLRTELAGRSENVSVARFNVQAAERGVAEARARAARSTAATGSLRQLGLTQRVTEAEQNLAQAERDLAAAEQNRDRTQEALALNERQRGAQITETTRKLREQIAAVRFANLQRLSPGFAREVRTATSEIALERLLNLTEELSRSGDDVERSVGGALFTIATSLNRLPTEKQIQIVIREAGRGRSVNDIVRDILGIEVSTEQIRARGLRTVLSTSAALEQEFVAARRILKTHQEELKERRDILRTRNDELRSARNALAAARDNVTAAREAAAAAREGLQSARDALAASQQALGDTIRQAREGVTQAVRDAKQNLDSLGQSIADALGKFSDKAGETLGRGGSLGKQFQALRDEILAAGGGADAQRIRQQIASRAERAAPAGDTGERLQRQFADLTDAFNRGKISQREFNRRLNELLRGVDLRRFQELFGTAATAQLRAQIAVLRTQARLIGTGPQRAGGGFQATIVRPLQAVASGARDVAAAQKTVANAQRDVTKAQLEIVKADRSLAAAERRLRGAAVKEQEKNTAAIKANTRAVAELARVQRAKDKLDKPKPRGGEERTAGDLTNAGANTP